MAIDPYRTLGLSSGATLAEVKAAYRRLAKVHHPDSAGEAAVPRFLAIQAAYEAILARRREGSRRATRTPPPPWQADPGRTRATRNGWRTRRPPSDDPAASDPDAAGEGSARRASTSGSSTSGSAASGSAADSRAGRRSRRSPGAGSASPGGTGSPRGGRRSTRKATLGSTSYDEVDREPFDPDWAGASWYGNASGTYWTLNPKEYADPRKHGPEYQARARRSIPPDEPVTDSGPSPPDADEGASAEASWSNASATDAGRPAWTAGPAGPPVAAATPPVRESLLGRLLEPGQRSADRAIIALLGWPPIGLAIATLAGEITGCGRFAAACGDTTATSVTIAVLLAQFFILALLVAAPRVAALSVGGTLAIVVAAVPVALLLSAGGASRDPATAGRILVEIMVLAWLVGVALAIRRRRRGAATA